MGKLNQLLKPSSFLALIVLIAIVHALPILNKGRRPQSFIDQLQRLSNDFFPPDFSDFSNILSALNETLQIATLSTLFAVLMSLALVAVGNSLTSGPFMQILVRALITFVRSIPSLVWAVIFVALLGANPLAGVVALAVYSVGYLGKFFSESIDQIHKEAIDWLKSQGANRLQIFSYAIWPTIRGSLVSHSLWMWEYNIRSASIIGYVGLGGLGLQLYIYQEYGQWQKFSAIVIVIFAIISLLELTSSLFKKSQRKER